MATTLGGVCIAAGKQKLGLYVNFVGCGVVGFWSMVVLGFTTRLHVLGLFLGLMAAPLT